MSDNAEFSKNIKIAQAYFKKYYTGKNIVDELIEGRRKEARREMMEYGGPITLSFVRKYLHEVLNYVSITENEVVVTKGGKPIVKIVKTSD